MTFLKGILEWVTRTYDRLLAAVAVAVLLGSVIWGIIGLGRMRSDQRAFSAWIDSRTPEHPEAQDVDLSGYEEALRQLERPPQVELGTNQALFVAETRCWCVDCLRPIPLTADVCPFCLVRQPPREPSADLDSDYDGMTDVWERQYGLDPRNPEDAQQDADADGFRNVDEFRADPKTDPNDGDSHPPFANKLVVGPVATEPFKLLFKSASTVQDGSKRFAVNTRDQSKTYFVSLGEDVEGFTVVDFEERYEEQDVGGIRRKVEVSVLTLKRGTKIIPLPMGKSQSYVEYHVSLIFLPDGSRIPLRPDEPLSVRGETYKVISVDIARGTVVLQQLPDGQRFEIRKQPETKDGSL